MSEDREVKSDKSGHTEKVLAPSDDPDLPKAQVDQDLPRAPGGADSTVLESDVGSGAHSSEELLTADQPLSAQTRDVDVPDAIQEGEEPEEGAENDGASDPEASKPD